MAKVKKVRRAQESLNTATTKHRPEVAPLRPMNEAQTELITSILTNSQTFIVGPAGAGKTYIPAAIAAQLLHARDIAKIILVRPAVEAEERLGFLPGTLGEKLEPWARPFIEVVQERLGKAECDRHLKNGNIQIQSFSYMRGLTFRNAFVMLDEAQNVTPGQMKLFLTRIGEDCKIVVNGDISQRDIKGQSGLGVALRLIETHRIKAGLIEFTKADIVRSGLCRQWVEAFDADERA